MSDIDFRGMNGRGLNASGLRAFHVASRDIRSGGLMAFRGWGRSFGKYNARRVEKSGKSFASRLESAVHDILLKQEADGEIRDIVLQPQVRMTKAKLGYKPDFSYVDVKTGETVWVEAKGVELPEWKRNERLWRFYGPGTLFIFKGTYRKPALHRVVVPVKNICPTCGEVEE